MKRVAYFDCIYPQQVIAAEIMQEFTKGLLKIAKDLGINPVLSIHDSEEVLIEGTEEQCAQFKERSHQLFLEVSKTKGVTTNEYYRSRQTSNRKDCRSS